VKVTRAALVVLTVILVAACSGDDADQSTNSTPPTTEAPPPATSLYDLVTGDCFSGLNRNQDLRVRIVDCDRRHQAEVYGTFEMNVRRFPGAEVLRRQAATACAQRFSEYTGEPVGPGTEVAFAEIVPTLDSWTAGDRTALCVALGLDGVFLRGSIALDAA
jgi:hypothetical protein